ncbi:MAG: hypothetical protein R3F61_24085 [Myxococcota bacterium]
MLLLTLLACGWNQIPHGQYLNEDLPLWDAASAVPTADGIYFSLPRAGALALVPRARDASLVDLGEGRLTLLQGVEGTDVVVALVERTACDPEDERDLRRIDTVDACPDRYRVVSTDVMAVDDGAVLSSVSIDGRYNRLTFSDDARFAVAYLDFADPSLVLQGVVDLTSIVVLDLTTGRSQLVNVGFAADRVRFQSGPSGETTGLVVLSRSEVAQIDLAAEPWDVGTTFNLTLDPDSVVVPSAVELTPDGRYALITVDGQADLYALDLEQHSINLLELAGRPSDLEVCETGDVTVVTYSDQAVVEVFDHDRFEFDTYTLDERMNRILEGDGFVVLFSDLGLKDAYRLDLASGELVEYRLENPPFDMQLAPTGEFAVAFTRAESGGGGTELYDARPGMEVLDLLGDSTRPYLLEGRGVGLAFSEGDGRLDALVLQENVRYLYQLDLYTGDAVTLDLDVPPAGIGSLADGTFLITHATALGGVSFLEPSSGQLTSRFGFATLGLLDPIELVEAP